MSGQDTASPTEVPEAWLVRVEPGTADQLMERTLRMAERRGATLLFLDEDMTFGADHLTSALHHAKKAFAEGRNSSDSLAMETLLYASGERQLSSAIRKMGVDDETTGVVIARLTEVDVDPETGWTPYRDDLRQPDEERLLRFGISREELATAHETRRLDLVLEKVAAVDLIRK